MVHSSAVHGVVGVGGQAGADVPPLDVGLTRLVRLSSLGNRESVHVRQPFGNGNDQYKVYVTDEDKELICLPALITQPKPIANPSTLLLVTLTGAQMKGGRSDRTVELR